MPIRPFNGIDTMTITLKLFAIYRDLFDQSEFTIDVSDGTTVASLFQQVVGEKAEAGLRRATMFAVNESYATSDTVLTNGDRVAFIPPVSGG